MKLKHQNLENQIVGRVFKITRILGKGSFGIVYEATDKFIGRKFAIKTIPKALLYQQPKFQELVPTQINILRQCKNPNVVKYVDDFTTQNSILIVMEFCDGGDLQDYLYSKTKLPQDQATQFLKQILNGFKGLHEVGAMHRDFKLANVLLHNGICKISDFGLAKQMKISDLTMMCLGSNTTMAPEVLAQKPYGMEADLWSIGVVYYQMIYGRYPYSGASDEDVLRKILKTRPDFSGVSISKECRNFIERCLTVDPIKRMQWNQIYQHPLLNQSSLHSLRDVRSRIFAKQNYQFYQRQKQNLKPNNMLSFEKKQEIKWKQHQERQMNNVQKLYQQQNRIQERENNFNLYEKKYVNKRNQILFIFKYVCVHSNILAQYKANHGIALYITAKKAYIDMKNLIDKAKRHENIFDLNQDWDQFAKSPVYSEILKQLQDDLEMIRAQALSYQLDIQIKSNEIEAEKNIEKVASKKWETMVKDTVKEYWFLLAEEIKNKLHNNQTQKQSKQILIRVLQALDYYNEKKDLNLITKWNTSNPLQRSQ